MIRRPPAALRRSLKAALPRGISGSAAALFALAACAGPRPLPPSEPAAERAPAAAPAAASPCVNLAYGFQCTPPPGFVITQEGPGPGTVLTMIRRAFAAQEGPSLRLRVYPLQGAPLKRFTEKRVIGSLQKAQGVSALKSKAAKIGHREGIEVSLERSYASGDQTWRIFCFRHSNEAFLIEYTVPSGRTPPGADALAGFVESLSFED